MFVGGTVGTGEQWVSWIHMVDVARAIEFVINNPNLRGPVNVTAPTPSGMRILVKQLVLFYIAHIGYLFLPSS